MLPASRGPLLPTARCYPCWCELTIPCQRQQSTSSLAPDSKVGIKDAGDFNPTDPLGMSVQSFSLSEFPCSNYAPLYTALPKANTLPTVSLYVPRALVGRSKFDRHTPNSARNTQHHYKPSVVRSQFVYGGHQQSSHLHPTSSQPQIFRPSSSLFQNGAGNRCPLSNLTP